ncbi:unnamed protein product [Paramecium octaurelia]|uniref:ABC transporter family protein n=1 Tax=Paramecium octaurelia TaxID=43137 RepID=A0A8S1WSK0_PAROT|nr:unnamed protein product [Paramecium octaurelia]
MEQSFLSKQVKSDNWLFSEITPLINTINGMDGQIQNSDLRKFVIRESDCEQILQELKDILQSKPKNLYRKIFRHFFLFRTFQLLGVQTATDIIMLGNLLMLNYATDSLINLNRELLYQPILSICGIICLSLLKTYLNAKTDQFVNLFVLRLRLISEYLIYDKALRVQCISNKGESDSHSANINTLLTADLDQIMLINFTIRDTWEAILLITGCLIFLYHLDSHAGTIVVITMLCAQVFNLIVTAVMMRSEKKMLEYKDMRVGLSTDVIEGMKQIKYLSWEETFSKKIMGFRNWEFFMLSLLKGFDGLCSIFWNNVSYVLLCTYIISSVNNGKSLSDLNIFSLIAVFNMMIFPLGILPWCINSGLLAYVSFSRISKFLQQQEIDPDDRFQLPYAKEGDVILIESLLCEWPIEKNEQQKRALKKNQISDDVIVFNQVNENSQFLLRIDELKIERNTLNFIIGKIGSGKSALFNAILNELQKYNQYEGMYNSISIRSDSLISGQRMLTISDQIIIKGNIGYCSQTSWVQNMSIRDNILFGLPFNQKLYNQVIDVCEIRKDIMTFEKQDFHEIGPDGKNLSGGQKQRITLARALYQNCDIYLFDDIFSSLDIHIADQIFQKTVLDFLINNGKTVLLITSHYRYLNQVPPAVKSRIIYLENGQIINDRSIINEYLEKEQEPEEDKPNIEEEIEEALPELIKQKSSKKSEKEQFQHKEEEEDTENQEQREQGKINMNTWLTYFSSMSWFLLIGWVIVNFFMQGSMSLIDFWLKSELKGDGDSWLHQITIHFNNSFTDTLLYLTLFALLITFVRAVLYVSTALRSAWVLFVKLNKVLMQSVMKFYDKTNAGRIINRIQDDTQMIDDDLSWTFHCFLENVSRVTGLSVGLIILEPIFVLILIGVVALYYQVSKTYIKSNREIKRLKSVNQGSLLQTVNETLTGIKVIRAFDKNSLFCQTFQNKLQNWVMTDQCGERSKLWFGVRLNLMSNLILICVSSFVILTVILDFTDDYSVQALAITYSMVVLDSFYDLFSLYLRMESGIVSVERVKQYFSNETENIDKVQILPKVDSEIWKDVKEFTDYRIENAVTFKNIFLTYENVSAEAKFALKNFCLTIKKGQKIAFVGRTGSGKTSILNILFGLYHHQYGQIFINGMDSSKLTLRELRSQLSVVPQFGFLYNASVKDNLDPQNKTTKEAIEKLFIDTGFQLRGINNTNNNSCNADFVISQNGSNLSNGEKQVLNFLRIVLMNKEIICLDEATSNMDPKTDQLLHDLLFKFAENRTLLVITHRLENIKIYDKIVVMEQGEIVEQGEYQELIKIEGGFFNKLMSHHQKQSQD